LRSPDDTIGDFKKLVAAQTGTAPEKIVLKKWWVLQHVAGEAEPVWVADKRRSRSSVLYLQVHRLQGPHYAGRLYVAEGKMHSLKWRSQVLTVLCHVVVLLVARTEDEIHDGMAASPACWR